MGVLDSLQHAFNAFTNKDPTHEFRPDIGPASTTRSGRVTSYSRIDKSLVTSVLNRIAMDAASIEIQHVRLDQNGGIIEVINSPLHQCLNVEANLDQTGRMFRQEMFYSILDEGVIASMPVITDVDPEKGSFDIDTMRNCKIVQWYPKHVKLKAYDEETGTFKELLKHKSTVAILENPFYEVMNEPNSIGKRLNSKLALLDLIDEQSGYGKLDLIVQLPYTIRSEAKRKEAARRRSEIQEQLLDGKYGIAYTDGTEKIIQLNRPLENNIMAQVEYLTKLFYDQLSMTPEIMNGTASEEVLNNYYTRTVEPLVAVATDEYYRKFLTKTARTQRQSIAFFRDPFKLLSISKLAEVANAVARNEIMTANEVRQKIGLKPSMDSGADELRNKNLYAPEETNPPAEGGASIEGESLEEVEANYKSQMAELDKLDEELGKFDKLGGK